MKKKKKKGGNKMNHNKRKPTFGERMQEIQKREEWFEERKWQLELIEAIKSNNTSEIARLLAKGLEEGYDASFLLKENK